MGKSALTDGRTIYISGAIDDEMTATRREIRELVLTDPAAPIRLAINSQGGSIAGAFAVLDEMEMVRADEDVQVTFIGLVQGRAYSAALTILQGCDRRIAGSHAILMAHGIWCRAAGDRQEHRANDRLIKMMHERMARLYARRSGSNVGHWLDAFDEDTPQYVSPESALALGLIDEIAGRG